MRLSKIQKFLKENNIDYKYTTNTYSGYEFGSISINSEKTNFSKIDEITGTRGIKPSGIYVSYYDKKNKKSTSYTILNQTEVIERIKKEIQGE